MARIAGVDLPNNKNIEIALTYIYGIGLSRAKETLKKTNINPLKKVKNLTAEEINRLRHWIEEESNYKYEGALRTEVSQNIKRLIDIKCYRGIRHKLKLPCRGQRTRHNARTRRGKKAVPVAGKKKATAKK